MQWRIGTLLLVLIIAGAPAEEPLPIAGDGQINSEVPLVVEAATPEKYEVTFIDNSTGVAAAAVIKIDQTVATITDNNEPNLENSVPETSETSDQNARTKLLTGGKPAIQLILNPEPTRYPPYYPPYTYPTAPPTPRPTSSYPYPYPPYPYPPYPPTAPPTTTARPYPQWPPAYPYPPNYPQTLNYPPYGYPPYSGYPPYYGGYPYGGYPYYQYPYHHHHHHTTTQRPRTNVTRDFMADFMPDDFPPEGFMPGQFKSTKLQVDSLGDDQNSAAPKEPIKSLPFLSFLNIGKFRK